MAIPSKADGEDERMNVVLASAGWMGNVDEDC